MQLRLKTPLMCCCGQSPSASCCRIRHRAAAAIACVSHIVIENSFPELDAAGLRMLQTTQRKTLQSTYDCVLLTVIIQTVAERTADAGQPTAVSLQPPRTSVSSAHAVLTTWLVSPSSCEYTCNDHER
jgi:hypothetical protein